MGHDNEPVRAPASGSVVRRRCLRGDRSGRGFEWSRRSGRCRHFAVEVDCRRRHRPPVRAGLEGTAGRMQHRPPRSRPLLPEDAEGARRRPTGHDVHGQRVRRLVGVQHPERLQAQDAVRQERRRRDDRRRRRIRRSERRVGPGRLPVLELVAAVHVGERVLPAVEPGRGCGRPADRRHGLGRRDLAGPRHGLGRLSELSHHPRGGEFQRPRRLVRRR